MKTFLTFLTFLFWAGVTIGGLWILIGSLLGTSWALVFPLALVSPAAFIGLMIGFSMRRH